MTSDQDGFRMSHFNSCTHEECNDVIDRYIFGGDQISIHALTWSATYSDFITLFVMDFNSCAQTRA